MYLRVVQPEAITNLTKEWNVSGYSYPSGPSRHRFTALLPIVNDARLYALVLEAHDKVQNVRYARRLVFADNASSIEVVSSVIRVPNGNPM
jgi:hypothetical protein